MKTFKQACDDLRAIHGEKFSPPTSPAWARRFFDSQERVKVRVHGQEITGTVSMSCGYRPSFMLMLKSNSRGASWLLDDRTGLLAIKRGRVWVPACVLVAEALS